MAWGGFESVSESAWKSMQIRSLRSCFAVIIIYDLWYKDKVSWVFLYEKKIYIYLFLRMKKNVKGSLKQDRIRSSIDANSARVMSIRVLPFQMETI